MKIHTITCHRAINHGAMLQAFALQTYLQSQGYEVEIIDYFPKRFLRPSLLSYPENYGYCVIRWLYVLSKLIPRLRARNREKLFYRFYDRYLLTSPTTYYTIDELRTNYPVADCYIAGSDQIWNTAFSNGTDPAYYLAFGPSGIKRLSYAASFSTDELMPGTESFVKEHLAKFDALSVREQNAVGLLSELGYNGIQVVDPVFLLSEERWLSIFDAKDNSLNDDYIFVYDFMKSDDIKSVATRLSRLTGWKIYTLFRSSYSDRSFYYSGPEKFVLLVKNAKCVISNSLHGTLFSLLFKKDFFVMNREDGLNNRMSDILAKYNLSSRLITREVSDAELLQHIDIASYEDQLQLDIAESKQWLENNLPHTAID